MKKVHWDDLNPETKKKFGSKNDYDKAFEVSDGPNLELVCRRCKNHLRNCRCK